MSANVWRDESDRTGTLIGHTRPPANVADIGVAGLDDSIVLPDSRGAGGWLSGAAPAAQPASMRG